MATFKTDTAPAAELRSLLSIADQMDRAKDITRENRQASMAFKGMVTKVNTLRSERTFSSVAESEFELVTDILTKIADELSPLASLAWTQDELDSHIRKVSAFMVLDQYTPEEIEQAEDAIRRISSLNRSKSANGTRTAQERIPGRPEKVELRLLDDESVVIARQTGNTKTSLGNLKSALVKYVSVNNDTELTEQQKDMIGAAIRPVVLGEVDRATIGNYAVAVAV